MVLGIVVFKQELSKTGGQAGRLIRKELGCDVVRAEPYCLGRHAYVDGVCRGGLRGANLGGRCGLRCYGDREAIMPDDDDAGNTLSHTLLTEASISL